MSAAHLLPALRERRLTVLAGAGVSVLPPSCLPTWWQLNHAVLDALATQAVKITPEAADVITDVKRRQDEGKLPPEFTSEVIAGSLASQYFDVLRCLEGQRPNAVHRWLAQVGGMLPAIVTTNFDTLIERAFAEAGVPLKVLVTEADFAAVDVAAHLADSSAPTLLVKLHGTATDPATCIDTLAQRKKGHPEAVGRLLRGLFGHTALAVLGYSGADLDAEPNYLYLRQLAAEGTPGLTWLYLPEARVPGAVESMLALHGERGRIERGSLPGWLEPLGATTEFLDGEAVERFREEGRQALAGGVRAWGDELGSFRATFVVAELAVATGRGRALSIYQALRAWVDENEPGTRYQGITWLNLARWLSERGQRRDALALYDQATRLLESVGAADAVSDAMNDHANLLQHFGKLDEAIHLYQESIRIAEEIGESEDTIVPLINIAGVLARKGEIEEALRLTREAIRRAAATGDEPTRALALETAARFLGDRGRPGDALALLREAETVRRRLGQDVQLAGNLNVQGSTLGNRTDQIPEALRLLDESRQLARRLGLRQGEAGTLLNRAGILMLGGDYRSAEEEMNQALALRTELEDPLGRLEVITSLVALHATRSQPGEAIRLAEPALAEANELGAVKLAGDIASNLGIAYEQLGQLDRARGCYEQARDTAERTGDVRVGMLAAGNLANVAMREGRLDDADVAYRDTVVRAREAGDMGVLVRTLANLANTVAARGQYDEAFKAYGEALTVAEEHELLGICGPICMNYAMALWRAELLPAAAEMLENAHNLYEQLGDPVAAGQAQYYIGVLHVKLGQPAQARVSLEAALGLWEGHPVDAIAQVRELLAQLPAS
jgi:tetratricopeptide (TPR) repeat protein